MRGPEAMPITNLVIVGGVAGGASAAVRARRISEQISIILFERGEYVSFANCGLPYYIGGRISDRGKLFVTSAERLRSRFIIDLRTRTQVLRIYRDGKAVEARNLNTGEVYSQPYDKLILSPGAEPIRPPIPGIDSDRVFTLRTISDMDSIVAYIEKNDPSRAVVVGGGFIGLEVAENLRDRGLRVTVVEAVNQLLPPLDPEMATLVQDRLEENGVEVLLNYPCAECKESEDGLCIFDRDRREISADMVILACGVRSEVELARDAGLEIGDARGIRVNDRMQTSDPDVFAIGDAVEMSHYVTGRDVNIPLAGPATKQARVAADNALGRDRTYPGGIGTWILRVFDGTAAGTGASEKMLKKTRIEFGKIYIYTQSHSGYYPGAERISLKLLFEEGTGRILGAQAVGGEGIDKRINVLATAIRAGMTVEDLEELELAYAPPYSSPKDAVNMAGFVASNHLRGDVKHVSPDQLGDLGGYPLFLDVRTEGEYLGGHIPGCVHVYLDELRARLDEIPRGRDIVVYCLTGYRSYIGCRILMERGYDRVSNLTGGIRIIRQFQKAGLLGFTLKGGNAR
jgi:NADPH-dependent 2,4-dienoyl-CoA reductase/sulfur reductase-like enzyme/rhodanese-related sulfurtransferase